MIEQGYATTSYGHVLARRIRSAVNAIPEFRRERVAGIIEDGANVQRLLGVEVDGEAKRYALDLLNGRTPAPLGHNRRYPR